jgi:hypothetical protein
MWKRFSIWALMLVFALVLMPLTFLLGFYNTFFDKAFYTQDIAGFSYTFVTEHLPPSDDVASTDIVSENDLEVIFKKVFTKQDFSDFFGKSYEAIKSDLSHVDNGEVNLSIPLDIFKGKQSDIATEAANILYAKTPPCAEKVIPKNFECIPKGLQKPDFTSKLMYQMDRELFSKIPSTFDMVIKVPSFVGPDILGFVNGAFRWMFVGGFFFAILFLGLIALLIKKPWQLVLQYEAKAVLLPTFLLLIFAAGLYFFPSMVKVQATNADISNYLLVNFLGLFFKSFSYHLLWYVVPVFALANIAVFYSLKHIKDNEPQ